MVAEDGETTWLDTEPGPTAGLLTYLEKMRFFSQVEPRDATAERALLSLVGPEATARRRARRDRARPRPRCSRCRVRSSPPAQLPPGPTARYDVRPLPIGGWARRVPLGVDLLVPRAAVDQVVAVRDARGAAGRAVGVRGDAGGRPAARGSGWTPTTGRMPAEVG